jgi:ferredoxin-NADP reductase
MIDDAVAELTLRVEQMTWESDTVVSLRLAHPDGRALPPWEPGAHVDVRLPGGLERQYSLCGRTDDASRYRIAVLREEAGRGGSAYVHDVLRVGDLVSVRGPRNNFAFAPAPRVLFIAGGVGITPLLPMITSAEKAGTDWRLLYGGRRRGSMAFLGELATYGDRVTVAPQDEVGLLDLDRWLAEPIDGLRVYCCGPEPMLAAVESRCAGWPDGALQVERFAARPGALAHPGVDGAFTVRCARSGIEVKVRADESILETLRGAGLDLPSSCEEGVCGTCESRVLEGAVDHRDSILSPSERAANDTMMICVSRARDDLLVLDL